MTDRRSFPLLGGDAPPAPADVQKVPMSTATRPAPAGPSLWAQASAGFRLARDDQYDHEAEEQDAAYGPLAARVMRATGNPSWHYISPLTNRADPQTVWQDLENARAAQPDAFKDLPAKQAEFDAQWRAGYRARHQADAATAARPGWPDYFFGAAIGSPGSSVPIAPLVGQIAGGFTDPINAAAMVMGGGEARTIAQAALRDAVVNTAVSAAEEPMAIAERRNRGETTTAGDVASDLGMAAVSGAALGSLLHTVLPHAKVGAEPAADVAPPPATPAGRLAADVNAAIPPERQTDPERAAVTALQREDATLATSPFEPGAGSTEHLQRMDAAEQHLATPAPTAPTAPTAPPPGYAATPFAEVKQRIMGRESRGDYGIVVYGQRPPEPLTGMTLGQVYDYQRGPLRAATRGRRGPNDIGSTGVGAYQFESQTLAGNAKAVFGDGWRDQRFTPEVQDQIAEHLWNSVRGRPEALANTWAAFGPHAPRDAPVLRREPFADDAEWAAAQTELDAATAESDRAQRAAVDDDRPPADADPFDPRTWEEDQAPLAGRDWRAEPPLPASPQERWVDAADRMRAGEIGEAPGALFHEATGDIDVKWGQAGNPDDGYRGGYGLAHILAKHPEMEAQLDRLPELIEQMSVKQRRPERMVLESPDHEASVALTWHGEDRRWLVTAYEKGRTPAGPASERGPKGGGTGSSRPGADREILPDGDRGNPAQLLRDDWMRQIARGETPEPTWAIRPEGGGDIVHWTGGDRRYIDRAVREWPDEGDWETVKLHAPDSIASPGEIVGFDRPDDVAADRQIDSLEHDLRQFLAEDEAAGMMVRLNEEGDVVSAADALEEVDADEAAVEAARRCL